MYQELDPNWPTYSNSEAWVKYPQKKAKSIIVRFESLYGKYIGTSR